MQNKPLLSISIMVSNRIDTIRKCMESIKPLLIGFPCELIALDTVGETTDGSIDVVREYTDKIYRFEWCNDFAKARNFGLEKCTGEWFMFMDDDEWFEDASEIVDFFVSGEYKKYNSANYKIHSYGTRNGDYSVGVLFRMVKRTEETKFIGRVHEYLNPIEAPVKEFSAFIHHYGYVFETEEERLVHSRRNISLLEPDFIENPWDMHVRMQLIQEYVFMEELKEEAIRLTKETFSAEKKYHKTSEFQWILVSYLRQANKENIFEEVVLRAEEVRAGFPLNDLADLAISIIEVNARCKLKQYEKGIAIFEHALEKRKYLLKEQEKRQAMTIGDLDTFLDNEVYCELLRSGIQCYYNLKNIQKASELSVERFSNMKHPVLTISVLVSNRKETARKCLDSIKPILREIPSELIITDTVGEGQSDGSLTIAKEYTDHIIPYVWNDDFAAARNVGLQAAKGEWFLYLDDDEWFENVNEIIEFFTEGEYLEYNSATYTIRNYVDEEGKQYNTSIAARMIRRSKNTQFIGCIYETFNNIYSPYKVLKTYVHHYGYVYKNEEEKVAKSHYRQRLLKKDLEVYPENLANRARLSAILSVQNKEEAVALCKSTLSVCTEKKDQVQYQWQAVVLFGLYENRKCFSEAENEYLNLREMDVLWPLTKQIICYRMARMQIMKNDYAMAYTYTKSYFDFLDEATGMEIPEEFAKYQDGTCTKEMLTIGAFCAWQIKIYGDAWLFYECFPWETEGKSAEDTMWKVFALAEENVDENALYQIIRRIMMNNELKPVLAGLMQQNPMIKQRISKTLESQRQKNE